MADIQIERQHGMSMAQARKAAFKWAEQAEKKFDMECTYEEGTTSDEASFTRSGVSGTLTVTKDSFELQAKLGFLLGAFKDKIEDEIVKNLDTLIAKSGAAAQKSPHAAEKKAPANKAAAKKEA
ncbi:putative polyhydroxyalkanoic acid system protein [compost metagenome]